MKGSKILCVLLLALCAEFLVYGTHHPEEKEHELDVHPWPEFPDVSSDPRTWIVYGSALSSGHLGGSADIFIQLVDANGINITSIQIAQQITAVIEPPPADPQMHELNGAIHLRLVWRQVLSNLSASPSFRIFIRHPRLLCNAPSQLANMAIHKTLSIL